MNTLCSILAKIFIECGHKTNSSLYLTVTSSSLFFFKFFEETGVQKIQIISLEIMIMQKYSMENIKVRKDNI